MMKPEPRKTIWLHLPDYRVLPLKPGLAEHVVGLKQAFQEGIPVYPDSARQNFFDVELENGWLYIHVYAEARTVYLVAQFVARSFTSFSNGNDSVSDLTRRDEEIHNRESTAVEL